MEAHLARDDHVTDVQILGEAAGRTGVDDAIGSELLQQQAGGDAGGDLADAGAGQDHLFTGQLALIELAATQLQGGGLAQLAAQEGHFLLHGADNTYFHHLPRLDGRWAEKVGVDDSKTWRWRRALRWCGWGSEMALDQSRQLALSASRCRAGEQGQRLGERFVRTRRARGLTCYPSAVSSVIIRAKPTMRPRVAWV